MKKLSFVILFVFLSSCSGVDFVYNNNQNITNPLYQKTKVTNTGVDINFFNSYVPMFFGENKENLYNLIIKIEEKKTKRSVETNQVTSNLRYELRFVYTLVSNEKDCVIYNKELLSYFSILPKSSGYNYGTDSSIEKKYELAITDNLNRFVSNLPGMNINNCL